MAVGVSPQRLPPRFPNIPVPEANVESLHQSMLVMKQCVELLTGQDARSKSGATANRYAPHVFIQADEPTAPQSGDLWLCTNDNWTFNIRDENDWIMLVTVPTVPLAARAIRSRPFVGRRLR